MKKIVINNARGFYFAEYPEDIQIFRGVLFVNPESKGRVEAIYQTINGNVHQLYLADGEYQVRNLNDEASAAFIEKFGYANFGGKKMLTAWMRPTTGTFMETVHYWIAERNTSGGWFHTEPAEIVEVNESFFDEGNDFTIKVPFKENNTICMDDVSGKKWWSKKEDKEGNTVFTTVTGNGLVYGVKTYEDGSGFVSCTLLNKNNLVTESAYIPSLDNSKLLDDFKSIKQQIRFTGLFAADVISLKNLYTSIVSIVEGWFKTGIAQETPNLIETVI